MPLAFIAGLDTTSAIFLIVCVLAVCAFETINGFHDTANAVATVIYTKSLKPIVAVVWSGTWNFIGAMFGGIAVAMGMIKLIPVNDLAALDISENVALVLAILITAIAWNLGTWYYGIPCSSSHTMVGSLIGAGFAFQLVHKMSGPSWSKALEIFYSLLLSPFVGFGLAIGLMYLLRTYVKKKKEIFDEPSKDKEPPLWIRSILILTCTLVSYFHGNNDGQKGVGLLLVVLMAFLPMQFALNPAINLAGLSQHTRQLEGLMKTEASKDATNASYWDGLAQKCANLTSLLDTTKINDKVHAFAVRKEISNLAKTLEGVTKSGVGSPALNSAVKEEIKELKGVYEFRPFWVVLVISLCLGIGTMVGWKRIVVTIGEKIGKNHLTYAQGASAEMCAAATIGLSSAFGLPVSTTHVLSSGIAGTMVAKGGLQNLQKKTIQTIALAWILTLPVTFVGSFVLYYLLRMII
jgi:inorganic phosphate transporter, PiT family